MKLKTMVILMAATILFTWAWYSQAGMDEIPVGKYIMQDAATEDWAWVLLEDGNKFQFNRNIGTSYVPMGTYAVNDNKLILSVNEDEIYRFEIKGDKLIFESGKYADGLVEIGTVFELSTAN